MPGNNALSLTSLAAVQEGLRRLNASPWRPQALNLANQVNAIEAEIGKLTVPTGDEFVVTLNALATTLPGVASGVLLAVEGFEDGDILGGVQGLMDACASLAPVIGMTIGALAAPETLGASVVVGALVGTFIGSIFSMISDILGFFAPKTEALATTVRKALEEQRAQDITRDIRRTHYSFLIYALTLNEACKQIADVKGGINNKNFNVAVATRVIDQLNFVEGNTMTTYWNIIDWLSQPNNQNDARWPLILDAACNAYSVLLVAVMRLKCIVTSSALLDRYKKALDNKDADDKRDLEDLWNAATAKLLTYGVSNRLNLDQLSGLTPAVQARGTLWTVSENLRAGVLDPISPHDFGGGLRKVSVTLGWQDQGKSDVASKPPIYQVYAINRDSRAYYMSATSRDKPADPVKTGFRDLNLSLTDIFATPGTNLKDDNLKKINYAYVYELSNGTKIEGKYRDENGNEIADSKGNKTFFSYTLPQKYTDLGANELTNTITSVRVVHDPYAYAEDPANAFLNAFNYSGAMVSVRFIVYGGGCKTKVEATNHPGTFNRILVLPNGGGWGMGSQQPYVVVPPFDQALGIAVDQDYLWVFSADEIACATHASVVGQISIHSGQPTPIKWITTKDLPDPKGVESLYPCDDGTLVITAKDGNGPFQAYTAAYEVDLKQNIITFVSKYVPNPDNKDETISVTWTAIENWRAFGFEKLPLFCWSQFESLTQTLEDLHEHLFLRVAS